jgi:Flp pilus assembly protein TadG
MMFALLVIPLTGAIGLAIDMGRVYHVAMHTQGALDSAALAAGRVAQVEKTDTTAKASKSASA